MIEELGLYGAGNEGYYLLHKLSLASQRYRSSLTSNAHFYVKRSKFYSHTVAHAVYGSFGGVVDGHVRAIEALDACDTRLIDYSPCAAC